MLAFTIVETEVRDFMNKLLREEVFDFFETRGVEITSFARFDIDGARDISSGEDNERNYCLWSEIKPYVYGIIKGKRPKAFKIIFSLPHSCAIHENASAYFLNLTFDGNQVQCTAAIAEKSFSMDRSAQGAWQEFVAEFLTKSKITVRRN